MNKHASLTYLKQQIMTASPAQLVVMLYEKAIASLNESIRAIEDGDIERRWKTNKDTNEIVAQLAMTLDLERGGIIANNLEQLYLYILSRLPSIDLRNDPAPAREVISILEPLHDAWRQLATGGATQQVQTVPAEVGSEKLDAAKAPADDSADLGAMPLSPRIAIST